jgi:VWFA-related protein
MGYMGGPQTTLWGPVSRGTVIPRLGETATNLLANTSSRVAPRGSAGNYEPGAGEAAMQWLCVLLAVSIVSPLTLTAQQSRFPSSSVGSGNPVAAALTDNVTIDVAVSDKSGEPVRGLPQQAFTILDDKQAKSITSFRAVDLDAGTPAPPIEIVLVIDSINADVLKATREREGMRNFLLANGGKLPLPVSLVIVTDTGIQPIAASRDGKALADLLDRNATGLRMVNRTTAGGGFERYQFSLKALDAMIASESAKPGRKLIVWVSPGWPLLARAAGDITSKDQRQIFNAIVNTSTALRLGHITLYNVVSRGVAGTDVSEFSFYTQYLQGVRSPAQAYPPNLALSVLAVQSGGLVLNGSNDLAPAMAHEIAKSAGDARSFYVLTFHGSHADRANEYHSLQVKVDQPGAIARTRTGYYAQP